MKSSQPEAVVATMRVLVIAIPAIFIGAAIGLLTRHPLTNARIEAAQQELRLRRENRASGGHPPDSAG